MFSYTGDAERRILPGGPHIEDQTLRLLSAEIQGQARLLAGTQWWIQCPSITCEAHADQLTSRALEPVEANASANINNRMITQ